MSSRVTIIKFGTPDLTWRLSTETIEYGGYFWQGKILNPMDLELRGRNNAEERRALKEKTVRIANITREGTAFIDLSSVELWGATFILDIDGAMESWTGQISAYNQDGNGVLTVTAKEGAVSWLKKLIPDECVDLTNYAEAARGTDVVPGVGTVVPTVFGGTTPDPVRLRAILTDRVAFRFLLCVGAIMSVVAVYKDRVLVPASEYTAYLGSDGEAGNPYDGYACIVFDADPRDDASRWPEIFVDVVGLNLYTIDHRFTELDYLDFNGTSSVVTVLDQNQLSMATDDLISIEFRAFVSSDYNAGTCKGGIIQKVLEYGVTLNTTATPGQVVMRFSTQQNGGGVLYANLDLDMASYVDAWHHFAFTADGTNTCLYVDGELVLTGGRTGAGHAWNQNFNALIGKGYNGSYFFFKGRIKEVRLWKTCRTQAQVQAYMNTTVTPDTNLRGYWRLDECVGTEATNLATGGNVGTITDGTWVVLDEDYSRNPALAAYAFLTQTATGPRGWGLGVDVANVDLNSFAVAIQACEALTLKLDGPITEQREAIQWLAEMERAMRGEIHFNNGKFYARVDATSASVQSYDETTIVLDDWGKGAATERLNAHILNYRYDAADAVFLGKQIREDAASIALIRRNESVVDAPLIRDHTTAGIVCDYANEFQKYSEKRIVFKTRTFSTVQENSVITVSWAALGIVSQLYRVTKVTILEDGFTAEIEARSFSASIFTVSAPTTPTDPDLDPILPGNPEPPEAATNITLASEAWVQPDGTLLSEITGSFTPGARTEYVEVAYALGATPDPADYSMVALNSTQGFTIGSLSPLTLYTVKITGYNAGGRGIEATATHTTSDKDAMPATPTGFTVTQNPYNRALLDFAWSPVAEKDIAGYVIRKNGTSWADATPAHEGIIHDAFVTLTLAASGTDTWRIKAQDRGGNVSDTEATAVTTITIEPSNVTGFQGVQNEATIILVWNQVTDSDLVGYEIREGPDFENAVVVEPCFTGLNYTFPVTSEREYRFWIRAKNVSAHYSATPASTTVTVSGLAALNVIVSYDEIALQTGTHDETEFRDTIAKWSTLPGRFSDYPTTKWSDFTTGDILGFAAASTALTGTYTCAEKDLGKIVTGQISCETRFFQFITTDSTARVEFATSVDGSVWSDWKTLFPVIATFRYLRFRIVLTRSAVAGQPEVISFTESVDVPDVLLSGGPATIQVGGTVIPFGHTFYAAPAVVAIVIGSGAFAEIVPASVTTEQFQVRVIDTSGTDVGGSVFWLARGY